MEEPLEPGAPLEDSAGLLAPRDLLEDVWVDRGGMLEVAR